MESNNKIRAGEFFKFTTTRPVAILMVVIGVFVFGLISVAAESDAGYLLSVAQSPH